MEIFAQATRSALRFNTSKGDVTVEDLWHMPLTSAKHTSLDMLARRYATELRDSAVGSFVEPSKVDEGLQLRFDIVKFIIDTKLAERDAKTAEAAKSAQIEKLEGLIEQKRDEKLSEKTEEELLAEIAKLK